MFTEETEVGRSDRDNSRAQLTRGTAVVNSTSVTVSIQDVGLQPGCAGVLQTSSKSNFAEQYFKLECINVLIETAKKKKFSKCFDSFL